MTIHSPQDSHRPPSVTRPSADQSRGSPVKGSGTSSTPELWTPQQVCDALACRRSWLYDQVEAGRFPVVRLGRQLRFRPADIAAYLDAHTDYGRRPPPAVAQSRSW